jgi:hypothetical protein
LQLRDVAPIALSVPLVLPLSRAAINVVSTFGLGGIRYMFAAYQMELRKHRANADSVDKSLAYMNKDDR